MLGKKAAENLDTNKSCYGIENKEAGLLLSDRTYLSIDLLHLQVKNTWGASDKGIFCLLRHLSLISLTYEKLKGMKIIIFWLKQSY